MLTLIQLTFLCLILGFSLIHLSIRFLWSWAFTINSSKHLYQAGEKSRVFLTILLVSSENTKVVVSSGSQEPTYVSGLE